MEASFHLMVVCVKKVQLLEVFGKHFFPKISCVAEHGGQGRCSAMTAKQIKAAPEVFESAAYSQSAVEIEMRRRKQELRSGGDAGEWCVVQLSLRQFDCQKRRAP